MRKIFVQKRKREREREMATHWNEKHLTNSESSDSFPTWSTFACLTSSPSSTSPAITKRKRFSNKNNWKPTIFSLVITHFYRRFLYFLIFRFLFRIPLKWARTKSQSIEQQQQQKKQKKKIGLLLKIFRRNEQWWKSCRSI